MLAKLLIATLFVIGMALGEHNSPVFLWGVDSPAKPALGTISQQEFEDIIAPHLKDAMVVAFQEENLTTKDFLCRTEGSKSCYANLQSVASKTYYPSVQNPVEALRSLTPTREYNIVDSAGKLQTPLECVPGKVTVVSFDDVSEDQRADILQSHDVAIRNIADELSSCNVVYLYLSTPTNSVAKIRSRRATAAPEGGNIFRESNQFLIFWTTLTYNDGTGVGAQAVTINSMKVTNNTASEFTVTMPSSSSQELKFTITLGTEGYFTMSQLSYAGQSFYTNLLTAPTTFSFACGNVTLTTIPPQGSTTPAATLQWNSLQFQAPFNPATQTNFVFGNAWDCVPFFTPGILSGLFVTILLLAITFTGICWMVDINTMDRFDDPKGKTITINASD